MFSAKEKAIFSNIINVKTNIFHFFFCDWVKKKDKALITAGLIVCILLIILGITPLFGIEEPILFLAVAVPTCIVLAVFGLKARFELYKK